MAENGVNAYVTNSHVFVKSLPAQFSRFPPRAFFYRFSVSVYPSHPHVLFDKRHR